MQVSLVVGCLRFLNVIVYFQDSIDYLHNIRIEAQARREREGVTCANRCGAIYYKMYFVLSPIFEVSSLFEVFTKN